MAHAHVNVATSLVCMHTYSAVHTHTHTFPPPPVQLHLTLLCPHHRCATFQHSTILTVHPAFPALPTSQHHATRPASLAGALNFTVSQATVPRAGAPQPDNVIVVTSNATSKAAADAANLSVAVHPAVYFGAYAIISRTDRELLLDAGLLGTVTVTFSAAPLNDPDPRCMDGGHSGASGNRFPCLVLPVTSRPLVITMSFAGKQQM